MDSSEERITFDNLPKAVATLLEEVRSLKALIMNLDASGGASPWMNVSELIAYLPGHTSISTIYAWCANDSIPHHYCGKALSFYRPEIDEWLAKK
jgi:hypothetical protein